MLTWLTLRESPSLAAARAVKTNLLVSLLAYAVASAMSGCKAPAPKPSDSRSSSSPTPMSPAARAEAARLAAAHPTYKLFLQKVDLPTILVVPESTNDDKLKNLLWHLRTEVRNAHFKQLGLHPTATLYDRPGYTSGILNIYRGPKCASEMYTPAGHPDPCGPSIHKSASYHWGDGANPHADEADLTTPTGATRTIFDSTDGWQTEDEARTDPTGAHARTFAQRIQYATGQTAKQTKQRTDLRFLIDKPEDELTILSYQFAADPARQTFLTQFLTLEQDHLCPLGFKTIRLATRTTPGTSYPIPCPPESNQESPK